MSLLKDLMSPRRKTKFLDNSASYFKLLKESEEKEISLYKLEIAKILNDLDIFFLKIRIISSIVGMVVSVLLSGIIVDKIFRYGFYGLEPYILFNIMFLYFLIFVMLFSYKIFKRTLAEIENLAEFIEE